jgi:hypothetical protein
VPVFNWATRLICSLLPWISSDLTLRDSVLTIDASFRHLPLRPFMPSSGKKEPRLNVGAKSSSELVDHALRGGPLRKRRSTISA